MNIDTTWYEKFSKVYDWTNDYPYKSARTRAVQALDIQPGDTVLDLFCGTGVNFEQILSRLQGRGTLIGIDGSSGMLQKARNRIQKRQWAEYQIILRLEDLKNVQSELYTTLLPQDAPVKVLSTLGPAGLPGWEPFWDNLFLALPGSTRIVTMDVHCPQGSISGAVINFFGAGSFRVDVSSYEPWQRLKARCTDYREEAYHPFHFLRGKVVVASGYVPAAESSVNTRP